MALTIRAFNNTLAEYAILAAIHEAAWGEAWMNAENRQRHDAGRHPDFLFQRLVALVDGQIVAHAAYGEDAWNHTPGKYTIDIIVQPNFQRRGIGRALYAHIVTTLAARNPKPTLLTTITREDQPGALAFLQQAGFVQVMRSPMSRIDVTTFDRNRFAAVQERVQRANITIHSMRALRQWDPQWQRHWYDLEQAINLDHPMPDHGEPLPFATFAGYVDSPLVNLDGAFFALAADNTYVGQSTLEVANGDGKTFNVGMTGVLRSHRRMGIATALKVRTIEFAQAQGAQWIQTANEENNPMYHLNQALGFQPAPAWLNFEKRLG